MTRERDYAYEALAEVTSSDMDANRGELNAALKSIRSQSDITDSYLLSDEIQRQARRYRFVMGDVLLTAPALAKHWRRVAEESEKQRGATNQNAHKSDSCEMCGGDRYVVVTARKPEQTRWMAEQGHEANLAQLIDEVAPCPDCNPVVVTQRRWDGTLLRTLDPGRVRELMRR